MNQKPVTLALVGLSGFADFYLKALADPPDGSPSFAVVAAVDPLLDNPGFKDQLCAKWPFLSTESCRWYVSLHHFLANTTADLVVLCTPLGLHCEQSIACLQHGMHVLCEKPAAATPDDVKAMIEGSVLYKKFVAIGYQWSYSDAVQNMKSDILAGKYGKPRLLKNLVAWPRSDSYYKRTAWAGKKADASGRPVFDTPVANATSHYLHHAFFLCGETMSSSAYPQKVEAQCYRANPIETFDTAGVRISLENGATILHLCSHACGENMGPRLLYRFEKGEIHYKMTDRPGFIGELKSGEQIDYGVPDDRVTNTGKLWKTMECCQTGHKPRCPVDAAFSAVEVAYRVATETEVNTIPAEFLRQKPIASGNLTYHPGMNGILSQAFARNDFRLNLGP